MRTVFAERRTLPSRTAATFNLCATVVMSGCCPWNENDEIRAATCSSLMLEREFSNSSVSPSEKYSCSLSPLMLTNGSTAIECGGGLKAAAGSVPARAAVSAADVLADLEARNLSATKYASAARTTASIASTTGHDLRAPRAGSLTVAVAPDATLNGTGSGDSRCLIRSMNAAEVSPP